MITKQIINQSHLRIASFIHKTPILSSTALSKISKTKQLLLKCENFQKIGAFKPRGAFNKLLQLPINIKTVCTHSSGNHAQALAYAASTLGLNSYIVMPQNSPIIKKNGVIGYGGHVIDSGNTIKERQQKAREVQQQYQAHFIHPYNDYDIIAGQATCAKQIFEDYNDLDYIIFPIGGGGLASGTLLSTKYFGGKCKPIGVEPYLARDAKISLQTGKIQPQLPPISIADGLRTSLGEKTFNIISSHLKPQDVILVQQTEIVSALKLVFQRMKIIIQPSSASVIAAVLKDKRFEDKKVCCIISGGNIDMEVLFDHLNQKAKL